MKMMTTLVAVALTVFLFASCERFFEEIEDPGLSNPVVTEIATNLRTPLGLELDQKNRLWVTEAGTGSNDGQVSLIMQNGEVVPVIRGFASGIDPEGNASGLNHLVYRDGMLWILHGLEGRLYMADVSDFRPGDIPLQASEIPFEEVGAFVLANDFGQEDTGETNLYNLTFGPKGDLFMTDAAANAIVRRDVKTGELSIFATFPDFANPTPVGPPTIDAVPTGITYDGHRFLVSTLTGFPFVLGAAKVYEVDRTGNVEVFEEGFTTLVDIELRGGGQPVVLQFAQNGEAGFTPESGKVIYAFSKNAIVDELNFPTDIELAGLQRAYITNLAEGKVLRLNY